MTYAELYGNIKKRPLKCGLHNKMITDASVGLSSVTQPLEKINLGMGDAIDKMTTLSEFDPVADASVLGLGGRLQGI